MLAITSSAPSRRLLGTLNGLAQMLSFLMRATGPLVASSLFVTSKEKNILEGHLVWIVWGCVAVMGFLSTLRLREKAAWRVLEERGKDMTAEVAKGRFIGFGYVEHVLV